MRNYRLMIEYEGTAYAGWQVQAAGTTIQGLLEDALYRTTGTRSTVLAAGRTDAGVHALGQVAAFRTASPIPPETLFRAMNRYLPYDIRILSLEPAEENFQPRHHAIGKRYVYLIHPARRPSVFLRRWAWTVHHGMDIDAAREGLSQLVGRHDFSSFRAAGCVAREPVRTIRRISIGPPRYLSFPSVAGLSPDPSQPCYRPNAGEEGKRAGWMKEENLVEIAIEADGFLRHMARNIAGLAAEVGSGRISPRAVPEILQARDRRRAPANAPAHGLFLERVFYSVDDL